MNQIESINIKKTTPDSYDRSITLLLNIFKQFEIADALAPTLKAHIREVPLYDLGVFLDYIQRLVRLFTRVAHENRLMIIKSVIEDIGNFRKRILAGGALAVEESKRFVEGRKQKMQAMERERDEEKARAAEAKARADAATAKADAATAKADAAVAELAEAKARTAEAIAKTAEAKAEIAEAQARTAEAIAKIAEAKAKLAEEKARVDAAIAELAEAKIKTAEAKARVDAATAELAQAKIKTAEEKARVNAAVAELAEAKVKTAEAKARADAMNKELARLQAVIANNPALLAQYNASQNQFEHDSKIDPANLASSSTVATTSGSDKQLSTVGANKRPTLPDSAARLFAAATPAAKRSRKQNAEDELDTEEMPAPQETPSSQHSSK